MFLTKNVCQKLFGYVFGFRSSILLMQIMLLGILLKEVGNLKNLQSYFISNINFAFDVGKHMANGIECCYKFYVYI